MFGLRHLTRTAFINDGLVLSTPSGFCDCIVNSYQTVMTQFDLSLYLRFVVECLYIGFVCVEP